MIRTVVGGATGAQLALATANMTAAPLAVGVLRVVQVHAGVIAGVAAGAQVLTVIGAALLKGAPKSTDQ